MKKYSSIYSAAIFFLLMLQGCDSINESDTLSEINNSNDASTLRMATPRLIASSRAISAADIGVEVVVSYTASGTNYAEPGLATRSGSEAGDVWELDINVPANTDFSIDITWFEQSTTRLDLIRSSRSFSGLSSDSSLSFSQDFSSSDELSNNPTDDDFAGFDADGDTFSNLQERIDGTDPFDSGDPTIRNDADTPLVVQPSPLNLTAASGSSVDVDLTIQNPVATTRTFSAASDSEWLVVAPASGSIDGNASVVLSVSASCVSNEAFLTGVISVQSSQITTVVPVELSCVVAASPPILSGVTSTLDLGAVTATTATGAIAFTNSGGTPLTYDITSSDSWLTATPANGQIQSGALGNVQVSAACNEFTGTRSGSLTLNSDGGNSSVEVTLNCTPIPTGPVLSGIPQGALTLSAAINESASGTISFSNSGDMPMNFSLSSENAWLAFAPAQGNLVAGQAAEITIDAACGPDSTTLEGAIALVSDGGNTTIDVLLNCAGPVVSNVSPASIALSAEVEESDDSSISFSNTGSAELDFTIQTDQSWLCVSPDSLAGCSADSTVFRGQLPQGGSATIFVLGECPSEPVSLAGAVTITTTVGNFSIPATLDCQAAEPEVFPSGLITRASVGETNGIFTSGSPPEAVGRFRLSAFDSEVLETIISGGSVDLPVAANEPFSRLYVTTEPDRYFDIQLPQAVTQATVILTANTELNDITESQVTVQAETPGASVSAGESVTITTLEVNTGELQVSVSWDQLTDVDLYLTTPSGAIISFVDPVIGDGMLDLDSNPNCNIDGVNSENISFGDSAAPAGQYTVSVSYFNNCRVVEPTRYVVTVRANGVTETFSGSFDISDVQAVPTAITTIEIR